MPTKENGLAEEGMLEVVKIDNKCNLFEDLFKIDQNGEIEFL